MHPPSPSKTNKTAPRNSNIARPTGLRQWILRCALSWAVPTVVLVAQLPAQDTGIFVMKVDGSEERKVVQVDGFGSHGCPRWSHDGKRLVFDAYFNSPNGDGKSDFV